jgi:FtsP/CotA-like multicopper oxidase with cupredoxin domain
MAEERQGRAFDWLLVALVVLAIAVIVVGAISAINDESTGDGEGGGEASGPGSEAVVGRVELSEFKIEGELTLPPGRVGLEVKNIGTSIHNLVSVDTDDRTPDLNSEETYVLDLGVLEAGEYRVICDIPGHEAAGMTATLVIEEGAPVPTGEASEAEEPDWQALDDAMTQSILAFPAETQGRGNQPLEPTILPDGTKEFRLTTAITQWEVEPGRFVDAWTYNGQVPGPAIRVDVGDKVRVIVDNQLPMGTDVHWHGIATPNSMDGVAPLTQPLIKSGETFTYEFTTRKPAIGMYHAHHHGQMQIPNGLFGTFIIGETPIPYGETVSGVTIPEDLEVAQEINMVLNDAGVIGYSLNGKSFPATDPYLVNTGDYIVVHYYNEGLQIHPMHQHQFPQLVFAKDGIPLDQPYWSDTVNVAPGERYSVLVNPDEAGAWVWHCHILTHVEREEGMFGMVTALVVQDA